MHRRSLKRVWIAKFWQTEGLKAREVEVAGQMVVDRTTDYPQAFFGEGKDWHHTRESAAAYAAKKRDERIDHLKRQIKRLKALDFNAHLGGE